jgi:hypothetical protein
MALPHGADERGMSQDAPISRDKAVVSHIRGPGMANLRTTYRALLTEASWEAFLAFLEPDLRTLLVGDVGEETWVALERIMALRAALARFSPYNVTYQRGSMTAEAMSGEGAPSTHFRIGDLEEALRRLPDVVNHNHRGGLMTLDLFLPQRAEYSYYGIFPYPEYPREFGVGFFERLLRLQGAQQPQVEYQAPEGDGYRHRYRFTWAE